MTRFISFLLFFMLPFAILAQIENIVFTMQLKNGDKVTGTTTITEIPLKTNYGTLLLPIGDVQSIKIGLQNSNFDKANLLNLLEKLENGSTKEKENAFDAIVAMNESAIPFIKSYADNANKNNSNTDFSVNVLYEVMLAKYKVNKNYSLNDEVTYQVKNVAEGAWAFDFILLETNYGRLKFERKDIAQIDVKIQAAEGFAKENSFVLYANKHISGNQDEGWLNTGILVKKGEQILINANGNVTLASLSGNKYSPDGGINGAPGLVDKNVNYGNVVLKIAQNGEMKKVGDNAAIIADKTGIIYLAIYETVFNSANMGYYNAYIKVK